jgi:hypothetical protein
MGKEAETGALSDYGPSMAHNTQQARRMLFVE